MPSDETPDAVEREREMREHEQAAKERDPHESRDAGADDSLDDDERRPAPPGPEAQQPRG
jgi:hypothetical protein